MSLVSRCGLGLHGRRARRLSADFGATRALSSGLAQVYAFTQWLSTKLKKEEFNHLLRFVALMVLSLVGIGFGIAMALGKIAPWTGRYVVAGTGGHYGRDWSRLTLARAPQLLCHAGPDLRQEPHPHHCLGL